MPRELDLPVARRPAPVRATSWWLVFLLATTAFFVFVRHLPAQPAPPKKTPVPTRAQPLDPLTAAERKTVEQLALADSRVQELLGTGPRRLIYVEFLSLKSGGGEGRGAERPVRGADVVFFQREKDLGVRAIVNLEQRAVEEVLRLDSSQVPMTPEDLDEAFQLARRNEKVRQSLGADTDRFAVEGVGKGVPRGARFVVRGLRLETTDEKDPCSKNRCIQLFFRRGNAYLTDLVVVNLTTQQVYVERGQQ